MENWRDELPDELKTNPTLAKYETPEAAFKGLIDANGRLGRSITIPSEDAGQDAWDAYVEKVKTTAPNLTLHPDTAEGDHAKEFWKMAGVPDDPKGYATPEATELPPEFIENLRGVAGKAGWTVKQWKDTLSEYATEYANTTQLAQEQKAADQAIVSGKFGLAEKDKMENIKALAGQFADPDNPPAWLDDPSRLTSGDILMLNNIVAGFSGKGPQAFTQPVDTNLPTPDEIRDEQNQIRERLRKEQYKMSRPDQQRLLQKLVALGRQLETQQ